MNTTRFTLINDDVQELLTKLCDLPDFDYQMKLIRLMTSCGASDQLIWHALVLYNHTMKIQNPSFEVLRQILGPKIGDDCIDEIKPYEGEQSEIYRVGCKLLQNPQNIIDSVSSDTVFVVASLITFEIGLVAQLLKDNDNPYNRGLLNEIYERFSPLVQPTPLWENFNGQFQKLYSKQTVKPTKDKILVLCPCDAEDEALILGFEVLTEKDRKNLWVRAHGEDDSFLHLWATFYKYKLVNDPKSNSKWIYKPFIFNDHLDCLYLEDKDNGIFTSLCKRLWLRNRFFNRVSRTYPWLMRVLLNGSAKKVPSYPC